MRSIVLSSPGSAETMRLAESVTPNPGNKEARIRVEAAGVNFIDVYFRSGAYKADPIRLGLEGAGVIEAIGGDVSKVKVGDRVAWTGVAGSYATHLIAPVEKLVPVPTNVSTETAAAAMLQGLTAQYLTNATHQLSRGEWCLVHAAAGGVGLLIAQMAKRAGAHAIGTVSTPEKAERAKRAGCVETIRYTEQDFVAEVGRITQGEKCAVVYDSVGQTTFMKSLDCLRPRGLAVLFGQSSGAVAPFDLQVLNAKGSLYVTRPALGHYTATEAELIDRSQQLFAAIAAGLEIAIHERIPLTEASRAHTLLENRKTSGKLLLIP